MKKIDDIMRVRIRSLRAQRNYTQEYVAFKLDISQRAYSKIETGKTKLRIDHLIALADVFKVPINYFFENLELPW
mgnify:FL=1